MTPSMKRIHKVTIKRMVDDSVTIKRMVDDSPDTSWLGEYSNKQTNEYSIDRAHSLDCPINTGVTPLDEKTRTAVNAQAGALCECSDAGCAAHKGISKCTNKADTILYRVDMDDASGTLMCSDCADDATTSGLFTEGDDPELNEPQCNCDEHGDMGRNELQYFNPSSNYKDETPENIRKYVRQDYERMESLNRGDWRFIGIRAEAEISLIGTVKSGSPTLDAYFPSRISQTVTSGGLWGVESDSSAEYFKEIEDEQLAELREQLHAVGFSKRAIAAAFKNVEHETR